MREVNNMNKNKPPLYQTHNQELYKKFIRKENKYGSILSLIVSIIILISGLLVLFSPTSNLSYNLRLILSILAIGGAMSIWIAVLYVHLKDKKKKITAFGVFIDEEELHIPYREKHWKFKDIEFIFIDENYHPFLGLVVVKTTKTKPVNITPDLLNKPKKLWSKLLTTDKTSNAFDVRLIENMDHFIKTLLYYGVKIYWRKKGADKIEVINKIGENLKIEGGDR